MSDPKQIGLAVRPDPFEQFSEWYNEARAVTPKYPDAMTLATCGQDGRPSARIVLFKGIKEGGLVFFTNYESRKGREILENPFAALVFYWPLLDRQVRIEGRLEKLALDESEEYFHSRPRESQLSAWASPQSREITGRMVEDRVEELRLKYEGQTIPLPPFWGGFRVVAEAFEFWMEGPARRHDRYLYQLGSDEKWRLTRLAP